MSRFTLQSKSSRRSWAFGLFSAASAFDSDAGWNVFGYAVVVAVSAADGRWTIHPLAYGTMAEPGSCSKHFINWER